LEAKRQNLTVRINLIIGFPEETWKDILATIIFGLKMSANGIDEAPLYIFSPYPGTEIFKQLEKENKVNLNDDYFLALASLNSAYFETLFKSPKTVCFNPNVNVRLLGILRTVMMITNYLVSYLFFPRRIFRSFKNIFTSQEHEAVTVLEHRLRDLIQRKRTA
jgi:anaerobic magnesium-protoporphyrin IX monomethyl ester cyclase